MHYSMKKDICLILVISLVLMLFAGCGKSKDLNETQTIAETTEEAWRQREGIQTLLIMGLDQMAVPSGSYRNGCKADMLMLLVIDEEQGKTTALQVNPDTVVSFTAPGTSDASEIPLGFVYSYGSGGSDSCLNQRKAVSKLLGGISIDHYMTFTVDSIAIVNDMLGGITVSVTEDLRNAYPEVAAEEKLTLSGAMASDYFRFRSEEDITNESHMERQQQYIAGMFVPFMESAKSDDFLTKLTLRLGDGFGTDLTLSQMMQMMELLGTYQLEENIMTLKGDADRVDGEYQFHMDADSLNQTLEILFG